MRALATFLLLAAFPLTSIGETPEYLMAEVTLPEGAVQTLSARAQELGIPVLAWTEAGPQLYGVQSQAELTSTERFLIYDPPYFLLSVQTPSGRAVLRGSGTQAQLIVGGGTDVLQPPPPECIQLLDELGLTPQGETIELQAYEVPLKLPRVPEGSALDPVLWAIINHPDWLGFARDYGLELSGLRVRVVVEKEGELAAMFEPYITSSSDGMAELLVPIPLLPELGTDPAAKSVRPPYVPHPAGG